LILLAESSFIDLLPNFAASAHKLHDLLLPVTFLLSVVGVMVGGYRAIHGGGLNVTGPLFIRLTIVSVLCTFMGTWGDMLNDGVRDLVAQTGLNASGANPGNAFEAYRSAIARRWGTDSASIGQQKVYDAAKGHEPLGSQGSTTTQITHYGYEMPGDPNYDSNSAAGIGNHNNQLVAGRSLAISNDIAQQYGLQVGETVSLTLANGQNITGTYDDTTGNDANGQPLRGRVDLYDPQDQYGSLSGTGVTGLNGLGVQAPSQGLLGSIWSGIQNIGQDAVNVTIWGPLIYFFSLAAAGIMWLMSLIQQVLYALEIAISPIFIGYLMVPVLVSGATRFFLHFVALCCWPLGWAICDLITKALIDLATNPTKNVGQGMANLTGLGVAIWIVLGLFVIGSAFLAPWLITKAVLSGHSGVSALMGATAGVALAAPSQSASLYRSMVLGGSAMRSVGNAAVNIGTGNSVLPPPAGAAVPNFAKKPQPAVNP
jgi:hypothetical protein